MTHSIAEIQSAYERDQRLKPEAITADDLPLSYESITDRWLTAVLCRNVPGAVVIGHQLGSADTGSSNRRRIKVDYNDVGTDERLPTELFCKAAHHLANRIVLGISGCDRNEVHFYDRIRPLLEIEAPRSFYARSDAASFNSMIILGDLTNSIIEFCNHKTVMTLERARSQMRLLATLHGATYSNPAIRAQLHHFPTWPEYFNNMEGFGMKEGSTQGFRCAEEVIPARLYGRYEEIWPATIRSLDLHTNWHNCLTHNDVHLKNWYVAGSGEMGLSDWQDACRGHWARDIGYAIATALTIEDRRSWEQDLIKHYLEELRVAGGPQVSFDEAWKVYRQQLITALIYWTVTLTPTSDMPDMQPKDTTLEFIRRIATAMDDLDSLAA